MGDCTPSTRAYARALSSMLEYARVMSPCPETPPGDDFLKKVDPDLASLTINMCHMPRQRPRAWSKRASQRYIRIAELLRKTKK
ncbi:hypothetical protein AK812_SmicGene22769 [Symbiodinium microadriaticum]|uniref:Uncharacterized protein n=1 Tax=Symbiodinium microadriaticum TaxID=2951 RepID=A0A1Q9DJ05_SYMMI|nr:hypothetical protein AK812_SmicGene22769 [Symbiodinium microadriaticum]CAE7638053.1 unnamed protein product [Symbiodinium sp. KB8]